MRLNQLDLSRYGIFTDRSIEFPLAHPDVHLIVGPNEAGKSTVRAAISDLLFGIEPRSAFNFLHEYSEMRLGAIVTGGSAPLAFARLKRNKQSLRDAEDNALPDDLLAEYLGSADRAFFERMFGLDHPKLVGGGLEILHAKDDIARMLFEASAGLGSLGEFRDRLDAEAKALWDKRKSKDRAYYKALDVYDDARAEMKRATSRVSVWKSAKQRVEAAQVALKGAANRLAELERKRGRLERIRRVASHLRKRREAIAKREALGAVVLLPEASAEGLKSATVDIDAAERLITKHQTLVEKAQRTRDELSVDERLLARREDVVALEGVRHRVKDFTAQIDKREAEVQTLFRAVGRLVGELGWKAADEDALLARIPAQMVRAEITQLLQDHGRLEEAVSNIAGSVAEQEGVIASRHEEIAALSSSGAPTALTTRLDSARGLGDSAGRKEELLGRKRSAVTLLESAVKQLHPWRGDIDALRSLIVPSEERIRDLQVRLSSIEQRRSTLQDQITDVKDELKQQHLSEQQLQRSQSPVTSEEVGMSREERDVLWGRIRSRDESIDTLSEAYESKVAAADALADRRYRDAAEVEKLEAIRNGVEQLQLKLASLQERDEKLNGDQEQVAAEWAQLMGRLDLDGVDLPRFFSWRHQRERALEAALSLERLEADLRDLAHREATEAEALDRALVKAGVVTSDTEGLTLGGLIEMAQRVTSESEATKTTRAQLERQQTQDKRALEGLRKKSEAATVALEEWNRRWAEQVQAASLAADVGRAGAGAALKLFAELDDTLQKISELRQTRIATMQRDLDSFAASAAELVAAVAPDLAGETAERSMAALSERLRAADTARKSLTAANQELADNEEARDDAKLQLQRAHAQIQPLLDLAKVKTVAELSIAISQSDELRAIEETVADETREALDGGDGLSLEELEQEQSQEDLTTIESRLMELSRDRQDAATARDACLLEKREAEEDRDKISGQADAASAAARSEEALAEMTSAIERYLKVFVAAQLLRWSIDRYREEKQAPLLQRASNIFAKLTLGSFEKLSVDFESSTPRLVGRRPGGKHTQVEGMSEGTRDQLYMALRMAAVDMHMNHGKALPFVADDLFINYDDGRVEAGFAVLAELGMRTQVIFLTHHAHLVPLAKKVLGGALNVVAL